MTHPNPETLPEAAEARTAPAPPRTRRHQGGVVSIIVVVGLIVLVGFMALAVDTGFMVATRNQLQNASDAAALSAAVSLRQGETLSSARLAAIDAAKRNEAGGTPNVSIDGGDVVFGSWDFDNRVFTPGGFAGVTAVQVTAAMEGQNALDLLLAPVVGLGTADVAATSTAAIGRRDLMLVQDVSGSFKEELGQARDALRDLTNATAAQGRSGDRIGLVTFNFFSILEQGLTPIPDQLSQVISAINTFRDASGYTHIATGLDEAINEIQAQQRPHTQRVIVLVSDGTPCAPTLQETKDRRAAAVASADHADSLNISIYSVFLNNAGPDEACQHLGSTAGDIDFMKGLVKGFGQFKQTTNPNDLDNILVSIVQQMPMVLVE